MARVPVVVPDEVKKQWQDYAKKFDEIDNVSDLVRTSVSKHIARLESEGDGWSEEQIEAIIEYLDEIDQTTQTTRTLLEEHKNEAPDKDQMEESLIYQRNAIKEIVRNAVKDEMEDFKD